MMETVDFSPASQCPQAIESIISSHNLPSKNDSTTGFEELSWIENELEEKIWELHDKAMNLEDCK